MASSLQVSKSQSCTVGRADIATGHETTSTAFVWMLKFLAHHQRVQVKLRAALKTYFGRAQRDGDQPTIDEIAGIDQPYTDAVMEEGIRLAGISILVRDTLMDVEVLGHMIPKGTTVFLVSVIMGLLRAYRILTTD